MQLPLCKTMKAKILKQLLWFNILHNVKVPKRLKSFLTVISGLLPPICAVSDPTHFLKMLPITKFKLTFEILNSKHYKHALPISVYMCTLLILIYYTVNTLLVKKIRVH